MTSSNINAIFCLLVLTPAMLQAVKLSIEPAHQHVKDDTGTALVTCRLTDSDGQPRPITVCQVMMQERYPGNTSTHLDLSLGNSSQLPDRYTFNGQELQGGDCGLLIKPPHDHHVFIVTCRVRTTDEPRWVYSDEALIYITDYKELPFALTPRHVFALPGSRVNITTAAEDRSLDLCYFRLPPHYTRIDFNLGERSNDSQPEHSYVGKGMHQGDCGISLLVSADSSGQVLVRIAHFRGWTSWYTSFRHTALIVTTPPQSITLTLNSKQLNDGSILSATCRVTNSRPVANITWLFGGEIVRLDELNEEADNDEWVTQYDLQNITQTYHRTVWEADSGKELLCRASHVALDKGTADSNKLTLYVAPRMHNSTVTGITFEE